jgi:hypothetical protein
MGNFVESNNNLFDAREAIKILGEQQNLIDDE